MGPEPIPQQDWYGGIRSPNITFANVAETFELARVDLDFWTSASACLFGTSCSRFLMNYGHRNASQFRDSPCRNLARWFGSSNSCKVFILHAAPGSGQGLTWLKYGRYKSLQVWDPSRITGKPSHHPLNIFGYCWWWPAYFRAPRLSNSDLPICQLEGDQATQPIPTRCIQIYS